MMRSVAVWGLSEKRNIINRQRLWLIRELVKNKHRKFVSLFCVSNFHRSPQKMLRFHYIFRRKFSRKRRKKSFRLYLPCCPRQNASKWTFESYFKMTSTESWERFWWWNFPRGKEKIEKLWRWKVFLTLASQSTLNVIHFVFTFAWEREIYSDKIRSFCGKLSLDYPFLRRTIVLPKTFFVSRPFD
jgi:hypothetical protein